MGQHEKPKAPWGRALAQVHPLLRTQAGARRLPESVTVPESLTSSALRHFDSAESRERSETGDGS